MGKMMKRLIAVTMAIVMGVLLASCAARSEVPMESYAASEEAIFSTAPEDSYDAAPAEDYAAVPGDYYNESGGYTGESYIPIDENSEKPVEQDSVITFSLKVDTASYTNVERYLQSGSLPPEDAVKTEEMINYFNYDSNVEIGEHPFGIYTEIGKNPFDESKHMAFVRVKAQDVDKSELPASNLVFLIDTSGSMDSYDKLPLLKEAFTLLTETLDADDRVSIVTYAGSSAVVLDSAKGSDKYRILASIYNLEAGGSTAGAQGIHTAYQLAEKNFIPGGNNRIVLATDGDFNVGLSGVEELEQFISTKRDNGIYLSALGFGTGNLQDSTMETLAKNGDGNYSYINSVSTANKVLVEELGSNLFTIADDVKAQVEFNPENVKSYRLIGYENRQLQDKDFDDDTKDAGEIGVGTDVVMLFELELYDTGSYSGSNLKYGGNTDEVMVPAGTGEYADELFEVRLRYKYPGGNQSNLILAPVTYDRIALQNSSDYNFACAVAEFGGQLRSSEYAAGADPYTVMSIAGANLGSDTGGYRQGFLELVATYSDLMYYYYE
ncbi:MAG: vWA domain-containing protein [Christensenellaceae bacterium]